MMKNMRLMIALMLTVTMLFGILPIHAEETVNEQQPAEAVVETTPEPTAVPTAVPTPEPTAVPTPVPTEAPTAVPTEAPTAAPTEVPTAVPTEVPAEEPAEAPAEEPVKENVESSAAEKIPFKARVEIKPEKKELYYGDDLKVEVVVSDANMSYELKWERLDPKLPKEDQKWETFSRDNPLKLKLTEQAVALKYRLTVTGANGETIVKDFAVATPSYREEKPAAPAEKAAVEEPAAPAEEAAAEEPAAPAEEAAAEEPAAPAEEAAAEEPAAPAEEAAAEEPAAPAEEAAAEEPAAPAEEAAAEEPAAPAEEAAAEEPAAPVEEAVVEEPAVPAEEPAAEDIIKEETPAEEVPETAEEAEDEVAVLDLVTEEVPAEETEPAEDDVIILLDLEPVAEEEPSEEEVLNPDRKIAVTPALVEDENGETKVVFTAELTGYDDLVYTAQWQVSSDNENWNDIPDANGLEYVTVVNEENYMNFWRVQIHIADAE